MLKAWRGIVLAAVWVLFPLAGRADPDVRVELPGACVWSPGDPPALSCPLKAGGTVSVSMSGLTADSVRQAAAGDAAQVRNIARFYAFGPLEWRDPPRAVELFKAAAAAGDVRAMLTLAKMYGLGAGAPLDRAEATRWYRMAAEHGDPEGMLGLGGAYEAALGEPQDLAQALKWYRAAADKGYTPGMVRVGLAYFTGKAVPQSYGDAVSWWRSAADANDPDAARDLAFLYAKGLGVPQNRDAAAKLQAEAVALDKWGALPSESDMQDAYPVDAAVAGVAGIAYYECRIAPDRTPEDCLLQGESPASFGFGEAGFQLLPKMRMGPGIPAGVLIRVPMRFALPTGIIASRAHADECAAETLALRKTRTLSADADWWGRYWLALSRYDAQQAGEADQPGRLDAAVAAATDRIAQGKDNGFLGMASRCTLH